MVKIVESFLDLIYNKVAAVGPLAIAGIPIARQPSLPDFDPKRDLEKAKREEKIFQLEEKNRKQFLRRIVTDFRRNRETAKHYSQRGFTGLYSAVKDMNISRQVAPESSEVESDDTDDLVNHLDLDLSVDPKSIQNKIQACRRRHFEVKPISRIRVDFPS